MHPPSRLSLFVCLLFIGLGESVFSQEAPDHYISNNYYWGKGEIPFKDHNWVREHRINRVEEWSDWRDGTDQRGYVYEFTPDGFLTRVVWYRSPTDSTEQRFVVNASGQVLRLEELKDEGWVVGRTYAFDDSGRLTLDQLGENYYYTYSYNGGGQLASAGHYVSGRVVDYRYDERGNCIREESRLGDQAEGTTLFKYDSAGRVLEKAWGDEYGSVETYAYDDRKNVTRHWYHGSEGLLYRTWERRTSRKRIEKVYNPEGKLRSITRQTFNSQGKLVKDLDRKRVSFRYRWFVWEPHRGHSPLSRHRKMLYRYNRDGTLRKKTMRPFQFGFPVLEAFRYNKQGEPTREITSRSGPAWCKRRVTHFKLRYYPENG